MEPKEILKELLRKKKEVEQDLRIKKLEKEIKDIKYKDKQKTWAEREIEKERNEFLFGE